MVHDTVSCFTMDFGNMLSSSAYDRLSSSASMCVCVTIRLWRSNCRRVTTSRLYTDQPCIASYTLHMSRGNQTSTS